MIVPNVEAIYFADIHVVESLSGFAGRTGWRLHEKLESLIRDSPHPRVPSTIRAHYHFIESTADLSRLFLVIASQTEQNKRAALIHLETHGCEEGLGLASGELVTWEDLRPGLTEMNEAGQLNLVVFVAACIGLDLVKVVLPTDRAPVRMIIGPHRVVYEPELELATHVFYSTLLSSGSVTTAYEAMNDALEPPSADRKRAFYAFSADQIFKAAIREYFQEFRDEDDFTDRVEKVTSGIAARRWTEHAIRTSYYERLCLRGEVRAFLMDHRRMFDELWSSFFFVDRQPQNAERFRMTFEECWNEGQPSQRLVETVNLGG
jgi:hypothetical protein